MIRPILAALTITLTLLAGCSTHAPRPDDPATLRETMTATLAAALADAAKAPLVDLQCPATGCVIASLRVGSPLGVVSLTDAVKTGLAPVPEPQPWWATALNTGLQVLGQVASIKYGLNGVASITQSVTAGMGALGQGGYTALAAQGDAAFTAYDSTARAALTGYSLARPSQSVTISGDGIVASPGAAINRPSTSYQFGADGVVSGGSITKPAPQVCVTNPVTGTLSCSPP